MNELNRLDENEFKTPNPEFKIEIPKAFVVAIIIIFSLTVAGTIIGIPAMFWSGFQHISLPLSFMAGGILAIFLLMIYLKFKWKSIAEHLKTSPSLWVILLSPLLFASTLPFAEFLTSLFPTGGNRFLEELYKSMVDAFEMMMNYKIAGFITVCIMAPIFEEILFRGILLRGLLQNKTNPVLAIVLSSVLFGLAHMNPWQFLGAGLLGALFGFVYYRTKSLWMCIFLHSLNNCFSYFLMLKFESMEESLTDSSDLISIFAFLALAILIGFGIYKLTPNIKWN